MDDESTCARGLTEIGNHPAHSIVSSIGISGLSLHVVDSMPRTSVGSLVLFSWGGIKYLFGVC